MGYRICNIYLFKVKVGDPHQSAWKEARAWLGEMLADNLRGHAAGRRRLVPRAVAYHAASLALDRVTACRMYFASSMYEDLLLRAVYGQANRQKPPEEPPQEDPRPLWFMALWNLLALTRRCWTYLLLCEAREAAHGYKGRLTQWYLGDADRRATLSRELNDWKEVFQELEEACRWLDPEEVPQDPVEALLHRIDQRCRGVAAGAGGPCAGRGPLARQVFEVLADRPAGGHPAGNYPALAEALNAAVDRLGGAAKARVPAAAEELCRETDQPGSVLPAAQNLVAVLDLLPEDHAPEGAPAAVVAEIAGLPLAPPPRTKGPPPPRFSRPVLLAAIHKEVEADALRRAVFLSMMTCRSLEETRDTLRHHLPGPAAMLPPDSDLLERAGRVLLGWKVLRQRLRPPPANAGEWGYPHDYLEAPARVWDEAGAIERALAAVEGWLKNPASAPAVWDGPGGVAANVEPTVRAALLIVLLEQLHQDLSSVY